MRDRLALPIHFDAEAMLRDLDHLSETAWTEHFVPENYEGTWSALPLRASANARHPIEMIYSDPSAQEFVDTPFLARCPYLQKVLSTFACPLNAVRLMKLTPGSAIKPHSDRDLEPGLGTVRLHIPIMTNAGVDFLLNGRPVRMRDGECWYLRLSDTHSVSNRGVTDRIHLVLDVRVNAWLEDLLATAERTAALDVADLVSPKRSDSDLTGWIPFRIRADGLLVDWCYVGENPFDAPFFEQTIRHCLRMSSTQRQTSIRDLIEQANSRSVVEPAALIFHGSRCGSTLFTQMARSLPGTIVISEAPPVDQIVRAHASEADRIAWLRALISVLGRNGTRGKRHLFVKFDAWHILDLPLIRLAFPGVPCVFLYRDPAAVIASQLRMPGLQMIPGMIDPSIVGLDLAGLLALDREEQCARMIGAIYAAALGAAKTRQLALLGYEDFWESACSLLLTLCRTRDDAVTRARLDEVRQFDAKTPSMPYERSNVRTASARIRDVSNRYAQAYYEELEAIRMSMMQPHATGNLSSGPAGQTH